MFNLIMKKIFGTQNARMLKRLQPRVAAINALEPALKKLSDAQLRAKTAEFKTRLDNGAKVDDLLHEAFATAREASVRSLGMRPFDVQLIGGMVLNKGSIAEMKTGEGKTLVATLPLYLNALEGRGCHLVTVNDYLAKRDSEWMGRCYKFLGLSVGVIVHGLTDRERQVEYHADITYGTNNEFGFDYLRDNMKESIERYVQRDLHYAIVDEVDSILIDEARTPLIISGPAEESADLYTRVNQVIPRLKKDVDYTVDEKAHSAMLTEAGIEKVEKALGVQNLYAAENIEWNHHVNQALRAHTLYKKDVNYVVEGDEIIIVDEFTGRKMPGRRWSDGLHQAVEAKENVKVQEENQTLATITFQNYFRMYKKLAGMTGTADTEAEEFSKIYKLSVAVIPTNVQMIRLDHHDVIYKNEKSKFRHVIEEIEDCFKRGQPVLVGTISVEKSEVLSSMLKRRGIRHNVLNAKYHEQEAVIVSQAGRKSSVTISTNMAGRGTDIVLGGNPEMQAKQEVDPSVEPEKYKEKVVYYKKIQDEERPLVLAAGGLHILGTERHESRRIDNQLRGRSGRQGDPGSSRFFLSLEDDLLRIFGAERITGLMERLGMEEDVPIEHKLVNRAIEGAQKRVEGHNFDIRKSLLDYDDVMNQQRKTIYSLRRQVLEGRYVPEVGEEDKKRGMKPPPPPETSGQWTIKTLAEKLRPKVAEIVDQYFQGLLRTDLAEGQVPTPVEVSPEGGDLEDPEPLMHELYRYFGAMVDYKGVGTERNPLVDHSCDEIARSLVQQRERVLDLADGLIAYLIGEHCPEKVHPEEWNLGALKTAVKEVFNLEPDLEVEAMDAESLAKKIWSQVEKLVEARETELGPIAFLYFSRHFFLEEIDSQWIDHLKAMDSLREGIGLRGYGQKDPKQEYKKEGFAMFAEMMANIQKNVAGKLFRFQLVSQDQSLPEFKHKKRRMMMSRAADGAAGEKQKTVRRDHPKVGRNDPCPCGSGKKYKKCHGANAPSS